MIVIAIPITIFLVQQQLQTRTQATPNTTLSFTPATQSAEIGEGIDFDIIISPGNNQVTNVKFVIKFDPTKLSVNENSFTINQASGLTILEGPIVGTDTISAALAIGSDPTKVIQSDTNLGTITFDVVGGSALPTEITFDPTTEIRSTGGGDGIYENVFLSGTPASVTILGDYEQVTPTPTLIPAPEASASPTPAGNGLSDIPICSSIGMDVPAAGIAPYTIEFTVSGVDMDGTIESISLDFGDENFEEITSGGGISTDAIDVSISHTFETPGDYTVSAILTDDTGETSDTNSCTTAVTITDASGNTTADNNETEDSEKTEETEPTQDESYNELTPTLAPTGPTETIMGIGALGAVLFVIGTLLFFAL